MVFSHFFPSHIMWGDLLTSPARVSLKTSQDVGGGHQCIHTLTSTESGNLPGVHRTPDIPPEAPDETPARPPSLNMSLPHHVSLSLQSPLPSLSTLTQKLRAAASVCLNNSTLKPKGWGAAGEMKRDIWGEKMQKTEKVCRIMRREGTRLLIWMQTSLSFQGEGMETEMFNFESQEVKVNKVQHLLSRMSQVVLIRGSSLISALAGNAQMYMKINI